MQKNLQVFENSAFGQLEVFMIDGKPHFKASTIATMLGYSNPNDAILRHCKGIVKRDTPTDGGIQTVNVIPEGDIYRLIVRSKLPEAEKFERWVFDEVLPMIRQTGGYVNDDNLFIETYLPFADKPTQDLFKGMLTVVRQLNDQIKEKDGLIGELEPKASYVDTILDNPGIVNITQIAKDYGVSGKVFNDKLHELGIQYKQNGQWLLYSVYENYGYTHSKTKLVEGQKSSFSKLHTKWTQKGRLFLYDFLKKEGIVPVIEKTLQVEA